MSYVGTRPQYFALLLCSDVRWHFGEISGAEPIFGGGQNFRSEVNLILILKYSKFNFLNFQILIPLIVPLF